MVKFFVFVATIFCFSSFANFDLNKVNLKNPTQEQVSMMKNYLATENKNIDVAACCEIAIYKFSNKSEILTLEKMEQIVKKYFPTESRTAGGVLYYLHKVNEIPQYSSQMEKNENYNTKNLFWYYVSFNRIKVENSLDYKCNYIEERIKKNDIVTANKIFNFILNDCKKMEDQEAIKIIKRIYRTVLPIVSEKPDSKQLATKIGLTLRSYGVDVK